MHLFHKKQKQTNCSNNISRELKRAQEQMENAYENFQNVLDPDLIDCYIYENNAAWKRYRFLLRQAKMEELHRTKI